MTEPNNRHARGPSIDSQQFAIPDDSVELSDNDSESSYAGSGEEVNEEDEFSTASFLQDTFERAFDPSKLDRSLVIQAQTSGMINAKSKELDVLQQQANERLQEVRQLFTAGIKNAKQVQKDLDFIQKRVKVLSKRAKLAYPIEYQNSQEQVKESR